MGKIKLRLLLFVLSFAAFFGPFGAVIAHERSKFFSRLSEGRKAYLAEQAETERARVAYLQDVEVKRGEMKAYMETEKARYESILANQKTEIEKHQRVATRTTTVNTVQKQTVSTPAKTTTTAKPAATVKKSKPKAAAKTKTS